MGRYDKPFHIYLNGWTRAFVKPKNIWQQLCLWFRGWRKMDREDGKKVVEFVLKHENSPNVVVHCNVGESRSKGAALAIAEITGRSAFHVSDCGNITKHERTQYDFFNRRVYELILMEHMRLDC